nr:zinc finger MYM-type protein 1-like [Ipomoea batatas]
MAPGIRKYDSGYEKLSSDSENQNVGVNIENDNNVGKHDSNVENGDNVQVQIELGDNEQIDIDNIDQGGPVGVRPGAWVGHFAGEQSQHGGEINLLKALGKGRVYLLLDGAAARGKGPLPIDPSELIPDLRVDEGGTSAVERPRWLGRASSFELWKARRRSGQLWLGADLTSWPPLGRATMTIDGGLAPMNSVRLGLGVREVGTKPRGLRLALELVVSSGRLSELVRRPLPPRLGARGRPRLRGLIVLKKEQDRRLTEYGDGGREQRLCDVTRRFVLRLCSGGSDLRIAVEAKVLV